MLLEADLPDDVDALRALVLEQAHELDILKVFRAENERLQAIIDALMRHRFGRKSEQLDADQFELVIGPAILLEVGFENSLVGGPR